MTYIWKQGMVGLVRLTHSLALVGPGDTEGTANFYFIASNCTLRCVAANVELGCSADEVIAPGVRCRCSGLWPLVNPGVVYQGYVAMVDDTASVASCTFCGYTTGLYDEHGGMHPERMVATALMGHVTLNDSGQIVPSNAPTAFVWWEREDWEPSRESIASALGPRAAKVGELDSKCWLYTIASE